MRKLFEMEIPEIYDGVVEIMQIARFAGYRSKILVRSTRPDVDPVGACVGIKGVRIQSIVRELGNERIDIVHFSDDPTELIANALSPARLIEVRADTRSQEALVVVPDDSYSLAIGTNGMNVRLASQLTGYQLLVRAQTQFNQEMASPEAREQMTPEARDQMERIFQAAEDDSSGEEYTRLSEVPGLTSRIIGLLEEAGINSVEELIEMEPEELEGIPGIGKNTARQILRILSESVEFEEI